MAFISSISKLLAQTRNNPTACQVLITASVMMAILVTWPRLVFADDCSRDIFDAADCMRTSGWGEAWGTVLIYVASIPMIGSLVKNVREARRIRRERSERWPPDLRDVVEKIEQAADTALNRTPEEIAARERAADDMYERVVKPGLTFVRAGVAILSGIGAALVASALSLSAGWIAAIGLIVAGAFYLPDAVGFVEEWGTGSSRGAEGTGSQRVSRPTAIAGGAAAGMVLMTLATGGLFAVPLLIGAIGGGIAGGAIHALSK